MMPEHSFLSPVVQPFFGFLTTVAETICDGFAEVKNTISPSKKRRRPSTISIHPPQSSPAAAFHPQQKRPRLSDASATNAAGPSVPTPAAFRSANDLLAATTSPARPTSQILTRDSIPTHPPPVSFSATPSEPSPLVRNHSSAGRVPSNLDFQNIFHYPLSERRSSFNALRGIWPRETDPLATHSRLSANFHPGQNRAQLYLQKVEQRYRARAVNTYTRSPVKSPHDSLRRSSLTRHAYQSHPRTNSVITETENNHPISALTKKSPTLRRTTFAPSQSLVLRRKAIQKKHSFNDARVRRSFQGTVQKLASAAEISLQKPNGSRKGEIVAAKGRMNLTKDTVPKPFEEILEEGDSILCQKLIMMHGPAMKRLMQSQSRSRHRELECWLAERDLREMQRKRQEARRLNALESRILKQTDHRLQQPPEDDEFVDLDYWNEEDSDWSENIDDVALAERKKQITVADEKAAFSPLSESAVRRLRAAFHDRSNQYETLAKIDGCIITGRDLRRLNPNCWLNDEIVNAYMALLSARTDRVRTKPVTPSSFSTPTPPNVKIMSSFFYSKLVQFNKKLGKYEYNYSRVRRWTRRFDVFSFDVMLIPINEQNVHWTLGVVDIRNRKVEHLDSMGTGGSPSVREFLMQWVRDEAEDKQKSLDPSKWKAVERRVPIQENTDDCGVFLCKYADFLCRGWAEFTFSQRHMKYFRARIAHELLMGKA